MASIDFTIRIERSIEDVFRVLTTPELTPLWSESAIEEHVTTPGPVGIGSRRRATVRRLGGGTWENEIEVTDFEPNRRIAVRSVESIVPFASAWSMAAANGGTRVDWRWEIQLRGWMRPFGPFVLGVFGRSFGRDLQRLKAIMESGDLA